MQVECKCVWVSGYIPISRVGLFHATQGGCTILSSEYDTFSKDVVSSTFGKAETEDNSKRLQHPKSEQRRNHTTPVDLAGPRWNIKGRGHSPQWSFCEFCLCPNTAG